MYYNRYRRFCHRISLIFGLGFLMGLLLTILGKNMLVNSTELLESGSGLLFRVQSPDPVRLFGYCFRVRGVSAAFLAGMAIAGLGGIAVCVYLIWCGICAGTILSVLCMRYEIRGMILFAGGIMPQALVLIPAYIQLMRWCVLNTEPVSDKLGSTVFLFLGKLIFPLLLMTAGCLLEAFINPHILEMIISYL